MGRRCILISLKSFHLVSAVVNGVIRYVCNVLLNNVLLNVLKVLSILKSLNNANVNRQPNPKPRSSVGVN